MTARALCFLRMATALVLAGGASLQSALAQQPGGPTPPRDELTVEGVKGQRKLAEESPDLEEGLKTRLIELYTQALDDLGRADEWAQKAAGFEKAKQEAPARLENIRVELAAPVAEVVPDVPPHASVAQLEQLLSQVEAELKAARDNAASLDEERKRRADRRAGLPGATTAARQGLEEVTRGLSATPVEGESPEVLAARRVALQSRQRALNKEVLAYEAEIASYDARGELLTARRDKAAREVTRLESLARDWQAVVGERRRTEAAAAAEEAEEARRAATRAHPIVRRIAEDNTAWAERRAEDALADKIDQATREHESITKALSEVSSNFASIRSKVKAAGLTHAMGLLLRRQREVLPDPRDHLGRTSAREVEISRVQVELIELEDSRSDLVSELEALVRASVNELDRSKPQEERAEIETAVRELLQARRGYLDALIGDYNSYLVKLVDLDNAQRQLVAEIRRFRDYVDERVLWVRSTSLPHIGDVQSALEAVGWFAEPRNWVGTVRSAGRAVSSNAWAACIAALAIVVLGGFQRRLRIEVRRIAEVAAKPTARDFTPTLVAFVWSTLVVVLWPALLIAVGWALVSGGNGTDFGRAMGRAFVAAAIAFLLLESFRQLCRPGGLGEAHFGWPIRSVRLARKHLVWLLAVGVPLVFIVVAVETSGEVAWQNSLGRFAFIVGQILLAVFAAGVLRPRSGVLQEFLRRHPSGWLGRLQFAWYPLAVGLPIALAVLAAIGFHYTALELAVGVHTTVWFILGLVLFNGLALRWLLVSRRRLAIEQMRKRREATETEEESKEQEASEPVIDLGSVSAQTRSLLRTVVVLAFFGGLWVVWADMLPALGILDSVELWSVTDKVSETVTATDGTTSTRLVEKPQPVTLQDLLLALLILAITFVAGRNAPGLLEIAVLQRLPLKAGERYAIATVTKYTVTVVGLVIGFGVIGMGWSKVQWLAAAMVVGLGFGLQEIFANFVSGLILLFERPIRIGDTVTVGDVTGEVTRIQIRATTITDWNRKELVIPNKEFVTGQVINWTLSDSTLRVIVPVGIAYGSNTELAEEILAKVAKENDLVLAEPKPKVLFLEFGDSSLNFELRVYVSSVDYLLKVRHQLHKAIDQEFRRAGIEIAFPQRDLHVRSIKAALPVENQIAPGPDAGRPSPTS
ncbi:MAG: mechanosensitive ion channel [Phycisphaerales bacterium]|nr:MAG: mechanosensitive ion channel [Phycisphaerales bacterium]